MSNVRRITRKQSETPIEDTDNDTDSTIIAARFREFREARKMSVAELARATRLKPEFIAAIEDGRLEPMLGDMYRLARGLNIPLREIVGSASPRAILLAVELNEAPEELQGAITTILACSQVKK